MILDVHEPGLATRQAAEVAQRYAIRSVEAARGVDLNEPAQAARAVARRTARRAARRAAEVDLHEPAQAAKAIASRATKRAAHHASVAAKRAGGRTAKRARRRVTRRVALVALGAGAVVAVVIVARRARFTPSDPTVDTVPDRFVSPSVDGEVDATSVDGEADATDSERGHADVKGL